MQAFDIIFLVTLLRIITNIDKVLANGIRNGVQEIIFRSVLKLLAQNVLNVIIKGGLKI